MTPSGFDHGGSARPANPVPRMTSKNTSSWIGTLAIAGTIAALFWLERRYPLRKGHPESDWKRVPRNAAMAATTGVAINLCERPLSGPLARRVDREQFGLLPWLKLRPIPEKILGVMLLDYTLYWWHVLLHRLPFLWRMHVVHHADLVLDSSTAMRFHWLEFLASIPWRLAQIALLGIRPQTLQLWQRLTLIEVVFHHSNLRLPIELERRLSRIVMTPRLHGIHHSVVSEETNSNFSSGLTIWDVLHRSLKTDVPQERIAIGVPGYRDPQELKLPDLLALPFEHQRSADENLKQAKLENEPPGNAAVATRTYVRYTDDIEAPEDNEERTTSLICEYEENKTASHTT
jgi:sterol desaturase/sphingolipid hydroxylase (fatty acid hydroxylase superfamily)